MGRLQTLASECRCGRRGKAKAEGTANIFLAFKRQLAAQQRSQLPADVQSQPGALCRMIVIETDERLKNRLLLGSGNARSAVAHVQAIAIAACLLGEREKDSAAVAVAHGVAEQIRQDLMQFSAVKQHHALRDIATQLQLQAFLFR